MTGVPVRELVRDCAAHLRDQGRVVDGEVVATILGWGLRTERRSHLHAAYARIPEARTSLEVRAAREFQELLAEKGLGLVTAPIVTWEDAPKTMRGMPGGVVCVVTATTRPLIDAGSLT